MVDVYQPSREEREKAAEILARLTPTPSDYEEYRLLADSYVSMVKPRLRGHQQEVLRDVRLRRSELFDGREYLIAYVDDEWLQETAPGYDAIASTVASHGGDDAQGVQLPPLVFIPQSKRRARNKAFLSVVEHEIVHINQVIVGTFPDPFDDSRAEVVFDHLLVHAVAEYEACYLQEARWPTPHPIRAGLSLEHWCRLRGYTQALEHVLFAAVDLDFPPPEVELFLNLLSSSLAAGLTRVGVADELASWFELEIDHHVMVAMQQVLSRFPAVQEHPAFRAAVLWLRPRLGITGRNQGDAKISK
jgi:hypothetical protein